MTACDSCNKTSCPAANRRPGETDEKFKERQKLESRLCRVSHKIIVLSGKGGVGKSTVAVNLAAALMVADFKVGLLDVDIHGPSIPTMLGLEGLKPQVCEGELIPLEINSLKVMSPGFFLNNQQDAFIWRGPMKANAIRQFLQEVAWGDLDFLIVDSPPGTGDEPLSVCQLIEKLDGAVIVTTPQIVAAVDVRKSITFCRQLKVPVLGIIENMNGFACPKCGEVTPILGSGGGQRMAAEMAVPFWGSIPIDPQMALACDYGQVPLKTEHLNAAAKSIRGMITPLAALTTKKIAA
jgi:Mrp family chromosome partitioning ATPase